MRELVERVNFLTNEVRRLTVMIAKCNKENKELREIIDGTDS